MRLLWLPWEKPERDGSSALWTLRDVLADEAEKTRYKIRGGNDRLPRAFADALGPRVFYSTPVSRIAHYHGDVVVEVGDRMFRAHYAVVAVSMPALRRIRFQPELSTAKRAAIDSLRYDSVVRTYHQFSQRPWERDGWCGFATTDHPDDIWHPTHDQPGPGGILMSYMLGSRARDAARSPARVHQARVLARMGRAFAGLPRPQSSHTIDWDKEPWIWGPYAFQAPGQILGLNQAASAPEGRIHFAGEHLSSRPSWMQGALESGLRAAEMIAKLR